MLDPETIDLARLLETLRERTNCLDREGYVEGRTALRDCVARTLDCSLSVAEDLVDTLVARGLVRFVSGDEDQERPGGWEL